MIGEKRENDTEFTVVRPMGPTSTLFFLTHYWPPFIIEWGGLYIGYMGNRERSIQIIRSNLNRLGLKKYNGLSFWALI